jgi:thiamine-monophosphate kinase
MTERFHRIPLGPGGEFDLIRRLLGPEEALSKGIVLGPGDDCTVLEGGMVVSTDMAVEGIHFREDWVTWAEAGFRVGAAALSDLAAMAAEPMGILLALALDPSKTPESAVRVQEGVSDACRREGIQIIGGDLVRSPGPTVLNVVALGRSDAPVSRAGTEVGDDLWVTGELGGSGAAVELWGRGESPPPELRERFVRPRPRIREAAWLAERIPLNGLIDLSDGLAGDAGHLAAAGGVALVLEEGSIPIHPGVKSGWDAPFDQLRLALEGGEDFELLLSVAARTLDVWVHSFQDSFGLCLTKVGRAVEGEGVYLEGLEGEMRPLEMSGFNHFPGEDEG